MQLKVPKSRIMASLKDEEETPTTSTSTTSNSTTSNININNCNNHTQQQINNSFTNNNNNINNNNDDDLKSKRDVLEARKHALESRLSENSWLLQQIQKQETAIINGNYEHMTIDELFKQLAQQYKNEQQLQALNKEMQAGSSSSSSILRRKQSTTSRESRESQQTNSNYSNNINNNNNRQSETLSNRSSEYDNYQPSGGGGGGDMLVIGVAQSQQQQPPPLVKSALKKRPTPTPNQMQYMRPHYQQQMTTATYTRNQMHSSDVMYSANSSNVATLRQPPQVAPQQQPIIVQCDKYYLSPTHQSYTEGGFIKSSQNIKKYVSPMSSPRQLDAISLAPSYISVEIDPQQQQQQHHHHHHQQQQQQQQYRWRSQSHIAYPPLTPPPHHVLGVGIVDVKSQSSDMLASNRYAAQSGEDISSIEKKPKPKQWLESSLDGPAVIRQLETPHSPAALSTSAAALAGNSSNNNNNNGKPTRVKLSSQSMSVAGAGSTARHYSMSSNQRPSTHHSYPSPSYAINTSSKALLSQSTSYLNAMEQTIGISASYPLEPLDIPAFRNLPPKPNQMQQPTPPPRPPPVNNNNNSNNNNNNNGPGAGALSPVQTALVSPPLAAATAVLSPDIRIESPKNMTVVQQATFQPYKEVTKPFEMSDFYKYSTKFKQKEGSIGGRPD